MQVNKKVCGAHMIVEVLIGCLQVLLLMNECLVLLILTDGLWLINPYIDLVLLSVTHLFNFVYYKVKCREYTISRQLGLEVLNLCIASTSVFLLF